MYLGPDDLLPLCAVGRVRSQPEVGSVHVADGGVLEGHRKDGGPESI